MFLLFVVMAVIDVVKKVRLFLVVVVEAVFVVKLVCLMLQIKTFLINMKILLFLDVCGLSAGKNGGFRLTYPRSYYT